MKTTALRWVVRGFVVVTTLLAIAAARPATPVYVEAPAIEISAEAHTVAVVDAPAIVITARGTARGQEASEPSTSVVSIGETAAYVDAAPIRIEARPALEVAYAAR